MDYIKLIPEYNEPAFKYNIISGVLFRMPIGYKNELKYYGGLQLLVKIFRKLFPNFYLRLYYDDSVLNNKTVTDVTFIQNTEKYWQPLFDNMKNNKYIQLCKYEMKDFKIDKYNHNGVIGTVIRFCPFLDLKENKNINTVICTDIDMSYNGFITLKNYYNEFIKSNKEFFYRTKYCYYIQDRFNLIYKYYDNNVLKYPIMAGCIITKVKIPEIILNTFFKCVSNNSAENCNRYKDFSEFKYDALTKNLTKNLTKQEKQGDSKNLIQYGIDELCTLDILKYLIDKNVKLLIYREKDINKFIFKFYNDFDKNKLSENRFNKLLKFIMGLYYKKDLKVRENFDIIDNILYKNKFNNSEQEKYAYILLRIKKLFNILIERNQTEKYNINDKDIMCVTNHELTDTYYSA